MLLRSRVWRLLGSVLVCGCLMAAGCALFGPSAAERLRSAMLNEDAADRREALLDLRGEFTPAMREDLEQLMKRDAAPTVRALAADALGDLGLPESVPELRASARQDSHWMVRVRAASALARIQGSDARDDLKFVLENEREPRVRAEVVELVAAWLPFESAAPLLLEALGEDRAREVRLQAHLALKRLTGQSLPPDYARWKEYLERGAISP